MLSARDAAKYSGLSVRRFKAICPVCPAQLASHIVKWDIRLIDVWLDSLQSNNINDIDSLIDNLK